MASLMKKIDLQTLTELAAEVEAGDPSEWGQLSVGQKEAFAMVGASILEMFDKEEYTYEDKLIMLSTITKLTVENMLLNIRILTKEQKDV
jgi:hypothetical protein